ncbi:uncharacterized protein LOC121414143 isoform X2 [Lytechinus variegatus]|uniref:uncharacterized protein LOC121414143 isoform X2 n=1 Tax=Lytechinus variegatus TaxID=7654 RepID=UPI001BB23E65|nr:uncharacterized protein LOC121414143 isoform X2 [Lytechinus variegatus]
MFRPRSSKASVSLYVSLGVTQKASQDDIERAYILLHKKYKQDVNEGKTGSKRKGLFTFCFTATCCCFCYCCHHCCNTCTPQTCEHDDDEIYIRENFGDYLREGNYTPSPFNRRHQKEDLRQAARRRRRDMYMKKGRAKSKGVCQQKDGGEPEGTQDLDKTQGKEYQLKRISKKSLISKDSGCDVGSDNNGYVYDLDEGSIRDSEGFDEEIRLDQASVDVHCKEDQGHQGNSPSLNPIECSVKSIECTLSDIQYKEDRESSVSEQSDKDKDTLNHMHQETPPKSDTVNVLNEINLGHCSVDVHNKEDNSVDEHINQDQDNNLDHLRNSPASDTLDDLKLTNLEPSSVDKQSIEDQGYSADGDTLNQQGNLLVSDTVPSPNEISHGHSSLDVQSIDCQDSSEDDQSVKSEKDQEILDQSGKACDSETSSSPDEVDL